MSGSLWKEIMMYTTFDFIRMVAPWVTVFFAAVILTVRSVKKKREKTDGDP